MLYFIWSTLGFLFLMGFAVICYLALKSLREKSGVLVALGLLFGFILLIVGSIQHRSRRDPASIGDKFWSRIVKDSLTRDVNSVVFVDLEETIAVRLDLVVKYAKDRGANYIPVDAYTTFSGLNDGHSWRPILIDVSRTGVNNQFKYNVSGFLDWRFLGAIIYSQKKKYRGTAFVQEEKTK